MDERLLIEQLRQGEEAAFRTIVETWQDMVYNTALGIVQQAEDAEDIAQEVFIQVHQSIGQFKGESKFSTWLYRITVTKALDHQRRRRRKKRFGLVRSLFSAENEPVVDPADFQHPGILLDRKEHAGLLFAAIRQLPENQRVAFTLHKVEGLSYQEVSEVMNTSVSSVESLMHRARNNLKKYLENYYRKNP
ncbi:MAG TPA: RNA polymerase sigma factor [Chitinophagaceae bacterium]|nr:RNA polymerase sigma factor [Chitinophagaceae bacterium]